MLVRVTVLFGQVVLVRVVLMSDLGAREPLTSAPTVREVRGVVLLRK